MAGIDVKLHRTVKRMYLNLKGQTRRLREFSRSIGPAMGFAEEEVDSWSSWHPMSPRRRLWLFRHGFLSKDGLAYDLRRDNHHLYLSDYQRKYAGLINGRWSAVNANKLVSYRMLEGFDDHRMTIYGQTSRNRFTPLDESGAESKTSKATRTTEWVSKRLRTGERLVLKPIYGGMGKGVFVCSWADGTYRINGEPKTRTEFEEHVGALDEYLVCEYVEQAAYADELFPDAANTLRVLTMWDAKREEAFVPITIHRIGSRRSAPVDNCSKGGLTAEIDHETGELGPAGQPPYADERDWHSTHPDTGTRIEGASVPGWSAVKNGLKEIATAFPNLPYNGWDLVVTGNGEFTIIEANNNPGVRSLQVHRPLLADSRTRQFYEYHGII